MANELVPETFNLQQEVAALAGGSSGPIIRSFPFAFNTPNISAGGAALYIPTIGDLLYDAWVQIVDPFDGTTPKIDVGTGVGGTVGWFVSSSGNAVNPTQVDQANQGLQVSNVNMSLVPGGAISFLRIAPSFFGAADPVKVWATQNGDSSGADPGCTQGAGVLVLITQTP